MLFIYFGHLSEVVRKWPQDCDWKTGNARTQPGQSAMKTIEQILPGVSVSLSNMVEGEDEMVYLASITGISVVG